MSVIPEQVEAAAFAKESIDQWSWTPEQLASFNEKLNKRFGEVNLCDQALAFALWKTGHPIQYRHDDGIWRTSDQPLWGSSMVYRLLAKVELTTMPSIDWTAVSPRLKWLTQDLSGVMILFEKKPYANSFNGSWTTGCVGHLTHADNFASAKQCRGHWRDLIVERPAA
ncbi:hypothetical protein [Paraburkholderia sp. WP4_3_2]|uniref:hypothetical protein n=1 Tax=Paraburkholderia sp. WP4_3_2 TaxID=2587162 RepID=UPI001615876F|nr:hypothetical protein [Paraburkholderia sp. WP4_3_2]MBB3256892.1 hypothetical protein [Paraburkholderia sp. WP4_3_2]